MAMLELYDIWTESYCFLCIYEEANSGVKSKVL